MKWLEHIQRYDEVSYLWLIHTLQRRPKVFIARIVSISGDGWMYGVFCLMLYSQGHAQAGSLFSLLLLAYAVELPVYAVLKNTLKRQRPCQRLKLGSIIQASDKFSFPSGHTAGAFVFAVVGSHVLPAATPWFFAWASGIGLSRVALGVHYPTDIAAGALLGSSIAFAVLALTGSI